MKKGVLLTLVAATLLASSCSKTGTFTIDGTIENGADTTLYLSVSTNGFWYLVDSVRTSSKGDFKIKAESPEFPEIYRLSMGNGTIYIPIDSTDHITLNTTAADFGNKFSLTGSAAAEWMTALEQSIRNQYLPATDSTRDDFKLSLISQVLGDPSSIMAYYIVNKEVNGNRIFGTNDKNDVAMLSAVATAYDTRRPNDPRTEMLKKMALTAQRNYRMANSITSENATTVNANVVPIIDIALPDKQGKERKLSDVASQGKVVVLNFSVLTLSQSPEINKALSDLYNRYHSRGLEIYQVCVDPSLPDWKLAAQALPWITVYDENGLNSVNLANYYVRGLPTSFVIDANGDLQERIEDITQLPAAVGRHLR